MDFETIKGNIEKFKKRKNFEEVEYKRIFNELDNLYKIKNSALLKFTSNEYILKEKENFRKYLIGSLLQKCNEATKSNQFKLALDSIKKLESLNPGENEMKTVEKIKQFCEIKLNWQKGEDLIKEKKYKQAIRHFKTLKEISTNVYQNDVYNKGLEMAKVTYVNSFTEYIEKLLQKEEEKDKIEKMEEITDQFEKFFL